MKKLKGLFSAIAAFAHVPTARHDAHGFEIGDPTPVELPVGFKKPLTLQEQIRRHLMSEQIMARQRARGEETLEDARDFEVDEENDEPVTPHEYRDMVEERIKEDQLELDRRVAEAKLAAKKRKPEPPKPEVKGEDKKEAG